MSKPVALSTVTLTGDGKTIAELKAAQGWIGRHAPFKKGDKLPETQVPACPRVRVADFPPGFLKQSHIDALEQNQKIASCCRHPENHEVEAMKTHPDEPAPDVYVFHCTCGKRHRFLCVSPKDYRPVWDAA